MRGFSPTLVTILIVLVVTIFVAEVGLGYVYFQRSLDKGSSVVWFVGRLAERMETGEIEVGSKGSLSAVEYSSKFHYLAEELSKKSISFSVLYIPTDVRNTKSRKSFFQDLSKNEKVNFLDVSNDLQYFESHYIYNLPDDMHLSRFGHQLVANYIKNQYMPFVSNLSGSKVPMEHSLVLGPLAKNANQISSYAGRPYRVETNSNGFRMNSEIKRKINVLVLVLGDSFTFGTGVNTDEAYPNILNSEFEKIQVINAAVPGIGLQEEISIYQQLSQSLKPDYVILQVLDNDIHD